MINFFNSDAFVGLIFIGIIVLIVVGIAMGKLKVTVKEPSKEQLMKQQFKEEMISQGRAKEYYQKYGTRTEKLMHMDWVEGGYRRDMNGNYYSASGMPIPNPVTIEKDKTKK